MATDMIALGEYEGVAVSARPSDGYINATEMCKAAGKLWGDYWRNQSTQEFVDELALSMGIPIDRLVQSVPGRPSRGGGTWVHRHVAIDLGAWISPACKVWMVDKIDTLLLTGSVSVHRERSEAKLDAMFGQVSTALVGITTILERSEQRSERMERRQDEMDQKFDIFGRRLSVVESTQRGKRRPFGRWVFESAACTVVDHWKGLCPICLDVPIAIGPWHPIQGSFELHHWRGKGGCSCKIAMPMCCGCHKLIESEYWRHEQHQHTYETFQRLAAKSFNSNKPA